MRRYLAPVCAVIFLVMSPLAVVEAAASGQIDLTRLYGPGIDFDVIRKDEKIGVHEVRFDFDGEGWIVRSLVELEVKFLAFFAFRYRYESNARWVNNELHFLRTETNDDGNVFSMHATRSGDLMQIRSKDQSYSTKAPIIPTNHWNADVLRQKRVLNTLTGQINEFELAVKERESISTELGDVEATRYVYSGDLVDTEVWYDDAGRWVKLRFLGRDGVPIEYACRRCQGGDKVVK